MTLCILALYKWTDGGTFPRDGPHRADYLTAEGLLDYNTNDPRFSRSIRKREITISPKVRDTRRTLCELKYSGTGSEKGKYEFNHLRKEGHFRFRQN